MKPITQLRDLYAHGYGRPHRKEVAEELAAALHPFLAPCELTEDESALGFTELPSAFGQYVRYDQESGLSTEFFLPLVAELSPVATRRLLLLVEQRVEETLLAASWGVKQPLTAETSKFVRRWIADETKRQEEAAAKKERAAATGKTTKIRREGFAEQWQRDREEGLARQAQLREQAKTTSS